MLKALKKFKLIFASILLLLVSTTIVGCANNRTRSNTGKVRIVTTTDVYGEAAKAVVGKKGQVESIITSPNVDPHDYDPTTNVAKSVADADIAVANGVDYDPWMDKLVKIADDQVKYIKVGEDVMGKKAGTNPHLWYDPQTMPKFANRLASELGKLRPKDKAYFKQNAQKFIKSLKPVDAKIAKLKSLAAKSSNKEVYVSEPIFDYALHAIGFKVGNPAFEDAIEKEIDPNAQVIKQMQDGIKEHKIAFFVDNKQVSSKTVNNFLQLAKKENIPVLRVTETLPAGKTYQQWMNEQYSELLEILTKK